MSKPTQKEPYRSYVSQSTIYFFPIFLLCSFASMFSWKTKICIITWSFCFTSLMLICRKNVRGEFLNRQLIIILYSFMEFVYYWSMLEGQTVSNKWYRNIAWITRTKSEVFLSNLAPSVRCKQLEMTWDELFAKTFHRVLGDFSQEVLS